MTYIEALACGLPVFARYDDVLKDLVIEEDSGFLFETPQEFAEKLTDFMHRSAEERKAFSRRALSKIVKYDSRVFYSKVLMYIIRQSMTLRMPTRLSKSKRWMIMCASMCRTTRRISRRSF